MKILKLSRGTKDAVIKAGGGRCYYCGGPACQVDHVHPRKLGGSDDPNNLLPACPPCNQRKGCRPLPCLPRLVALGVARWRNRRIKR